MGKRKLEFSFLGVIMGGAFFFLSFVLLHDYWIGKPFENFLSIVVTTYLVICTAVFPYIIKEMGHIIETVIKTPLGFLFTKGMYVFFYFVAPFLYLYFKFFDKK